MQSEPRNARIPVWALSRSLAATYKIEFSFFSSGYLDVSVHRGPSVWLWIHHTVTEVCSAGFPHSEIHGSMVICTSPWLIAAYHVFHRLLVPRHPPCALYSLTKCDFVATAHSVVPFGWFLFYLFYIDVTRYPRMSCYISFLQTFDTFKIFVSIFGFQGTNAKLLFRSGDGGI